MGRIGLAKLTWPLSARVGRRRRAGSAFLFPDQGDLVSNRPEPDWIYVHGNCSDGTSPKMSSAGVQGGPAGRARVTASSASGTCVGRGRVGDDAAGACGRCEATFIDFSGSGLDIANPLTGSAQDGGALHRGARRIEPDVRGAGAAPGSADVDRVPRRRLRVLRRHDRDLGAGQSAGRRDEGRQARPCSTGRTRTVAHFGSAVIPARPYKPRDKARFEGGVDWLALRSLRCCGTAPSIDEGISCRGGGAAGRAERQEDAAAKKSGDVLFEGIERAR